MSENVYIATPLSKHISGYEYFTDRRVLRITFRRSDHQYDYYDVPPEIIKQLEAAISKSKYFVTYIKPVYKTMRIR